MAMARCIFTRCLLTLTLVSGFALAQEPPPAQKGEEVSLVQSASWACKPLAALGSPVTLDTINNTAQPPPAPAQPDLPTENTVTPAAGSVEKSEAPALPCSSDAIHKPART